MYINNNNNCGDLSNNFPSEAISTEYIAHNINNNDDKINNNDQTEIQCR